MIASAPATPTPVSRAHSIGRAAATASTTAAKAAIHTPGSTSITRSAPSAKGPGSCETNTRPRAEVATTPETAAMPMPTRVRMSASLAAAPAARSRGRLEPAPAISPTWSGAGGGYESGFTGAERVSPCWLTQAVQEEPSQ